MQAGKNSIQLDSTNLNGYPAGSLDWTIRSNRWIAAQFLTNNLREVRLKFAWPVIALPNTNIIGPGRQTYRSLISSHLLANPTLIPPLWFFQPLSYTNNLNGS